MKTHNKIICSLFAIALFITACGPSLDVIGIWSDPETSGKKQFHKIFVFALTDNIPLRNTIETEMAAAVTKRGLTAVKAGTIMPPEFYSAKKIEKDQLRSLVVSSGCDGIVTFVLKDQKEETRYVPGTTGYAPMGYGYYSPYYGYYDYYAPVVYTPGYYTTDKIYFLESNFYDVESEKLLWSVQSATTNPTNIENFSKQYVYVLTKNLQKKGIIK